MRFVPAAVLPGPGDDDDGGGGGSDGDAGAHKGHGGNVQPNGRSTSSSRFIGVRAYQGCWRAELSYRCANHCLGMFETEQEAAEARDQAVVAFYCPCSRGKLSLPHFADSYNTAGGCSSGCSAGVDIRNL